MGEEAADIAHAREPHRQKGAVGIERELVATVSEKRRTYVMNGGRLHPIPEGLSGLVPSRLEPLLESSLFSDEGKRRIAEEPTRPARLGDEDESLASFIDRRFGREAFDRLIEPLMAGIYAGDGAQLSVQAAFPQLREMEVSAGSILGALQTRRAAAGSPSGFLTPRRGLRFLVETLHAGLSGVTILLGRLAGSVRRRPRGYAVMLEDGSVLNARAVILATPAHESAALLDASVPDLAAPLRTIRSAPRVFWSPP